eukprot:4189789-Heterocapsa_arctica.AAC.1
MKQQKLLLDPSNKSKIALFADARLAVVTMGMITRYKQIFAQCKLDQKWDYHVIDEMQCMNGDRQLFCGRVKRPAESPSSSGIATRQELRPSRGSHLSTSATWSAHSRAGRGVPPKSK